MNVYYIISFIHQLHHMRKLLLAFLFVQCILAASAQNTKIQNQRLKVFIDCSNTWCDMTFIRSEINIVDFLLDRQAADVHVLITEQETGGGGSQYQFIFFGQNQFKQMTDTIRFNTDANATEFEERDLLIKYLKLGLTRYIVKTGMGKDIVIEMKKKESGKKKEDETTSSTTTKDPWNYWVFRVGANGNINADEVYKSSRISGNFSANRVTEELKTGFEIYAAKNKTTYELEDDNGNKEKLIIKNNDYSVQHFLVKSINNHWSYGYEAIFSRNSFSNNKSRLLFNTGIEYNVFPYKEVNTRFFTLAYTVDVRRNNYFDTTLYDKINETLLGHGFESKLTFNQKWGNLAFGLQYHNYLQNWKYFNLGINTEVNVRITGGLSFNIYTSAELTRDQIFLPREGATSEEVLTRRRQLASGYYFYTYFGISYRFGSKLNNFVNPRFD